MAGYGAEEFTLTDIAMYVTDVSVLLRTKGLSRDQVQQIIDGYGHLVRDEWDEGTSSSDLAKEFFAMYQARIPMHPAPKPLYRLSNYIEEIVHTLVNQFGFDEEDALAIVDDFDSVVVSWFPMVPVRVAARRLGVMNNRLEAGIALHEG